VPHHEHENTDNIVQPIPDPSLDDITIEDEPAETNESSAGKIIVYIGMVICAFSFGIFLAYKFLFKKKGPPPNDG
jgi:hypothetical protein